MKTKKCTEPRSPHLYFSLHNVFAHYIIQIIGTQVEEDCKQETITIEDPPPIYINLIL